MPIPVTSLDDRRFDDLVAEARQRLQSHLPELTQIVEGDPLHALVDVFAWMTESVIYRANLIPERQRQAFLNLLQLPLRPATPGRGVVCIDAKPHGSVLPALLPSETSLAAGDAVFTTRGELQPTPLAVAALAKQAIGADELESLGIPADQLAGMYGNGPVAAFRPRSFVLGRDSVSTRETRDKRVYLLIYMPDKRLVPYADQLRDNLAGRILNLGLAPLRDVPGDRAEALSPRKLRWDLIWQQPEPGSDGSPSRYRTAYLPLDVVADSSKGGRQTGVTRLRMPKSTTVMRSEYATDPKYAGYGDTPPEPPTGIDPEQVLFWIALSAPEEPDFELGYLGLNAVDVAGQGVVRDQVIAAGNGRPRQTASLGRNDVDPASLELEVSERDAYVLWQQVSHFAASGPDDRVYRFDPASGVIYFGDGLRGMRPAVNSRIRAAYFAHGGGRSTNLPPGTIKQLVSIDDSRLAVRHEWPTAGGVDRETIPQAEQRIPQFLNSRDRAVTRDDLVQLARFNPLVPVGRAEVVPGLLPGSALDTVRTDVPGVVSVFVMPPAEPAFAAPPRPTAGMLRDVYGYLDQRKLLGTELYVLSPQFVPVALSVAITVLDPATVTETLNAVNQSLLEYLWALPPGGPAGAGWPMGRALDREELRARAARVHGVLSVPGLRLFYRGDGDAGPGTGDWQEVGESLTLKAYQLPDVMAADAHEGEGTAPAPAITQPTPGGHDGAPAVAVPVIPDLC